MNEADVEYRRMACHEGVVSPQLFLSYTPMISQSMMEQGASSMQMTCATQPSSPPSHKYIQISDFELESFLQDYSSTNL